MNGTKKIGWKTAAALVISSMIGTGVFTSLGFQLTDIQNTWSIVLIWVLGGIFALIGAFTYAELGTNFDESGGDYIFLSKLIHPLVGYVYAWTSLTVGFTAPIAISVMAMQSYLNPINPAIFNDWFGVAVILVLAWVHSVSIGQSGKFHNISTTIKIGFILALIFLGFWYLPVQENAIDLSNSWQQEIMLPGFAVALVFVSYAYTGWNAAAYIVDEIKDVRRNLPKALIVGSAIVTLLYVLVQVVFLKHASVDQLSGNVEVAFIAFKNLFGTEKGNWISYFIAIQLIATISGYLWTGSRITFAMSKDHSLWRKLAVKNSNGIPVRALWFQAVVSILLTLTGTFEEVLLYASFVLQLMGTLTVASIFWLRGRKGAYRSPLKPFLQIAFILFSLWILGYMLFERPRESVIGLVFVGTGVITYYLSKKKG